MALLVAIAALALLIVVVSLVAARRGTRQVTTWDDPAVERERIRGTGTGFQA
jgi:hypothetical protein